MLTEGLSLMVVGMVTVFSFLTLLVVVLEVSARVFESYGHLWPEPVTDAPAPTAPATAPNESRHAEIAVVLAAIEAHRRRQR